jgi:hypothetical protein
MGDDVAVIAVAGVASLTPPGETAFAVVSGLVLVSVWAWTDGADAETHRARARRDSDGRKAFFMRTSFEF